MGVKVKNKQERFLFTAKELDVSHSFSKLECKQKMLGGINFLLSFYISMKVKKCR